MIDYTRWDNFTKKELQCQHTGTDCPNEKEFAYLMDKMQELRDWYGHPIAITSGYRSPWHPIERRKASKGGKTGMHTIGAVDFKIPTKDVHRVLAKCFELGFTGIGVNMEGDARFIHVDLRKIPAVWSY